MLPQAEAWIQASDAARLAGGGRARSRWLKFARPVEVLAASQIDQVVPHLERAQAATDDGLWAVGFLTYESAPAFDDALVTRPPQADLPLSWWGLFQPPSETQDRMPMLRSSRDGSDDAIHLDWHQGLTIEAYRRSVERIRQHIAAGDCYQLNYTFPLEAAFDGDPRRLFERLMVAQQADHGAFVDFGTHAICSASPELLIARADDLLVCRPMKGTSARGRYPAEDAVLAAELKSAKNRAENLMIVDMVRNDLGRIARPGSVQVPRLFAAERYPTVHQLTSTVTARSDASSVEVMRALFPSASITGAPKVRTCQLIRELETEARGIYTGAIGFLAPGRRMQLNVAIRTVAIDRARSLARYGTGGGIVWDSRPQAEYHECLAKTRVLMTTGGPPFRLLETLAWCPGRGYALFDRHLQRLAASASYFDFSCDLGDIRDRLIAAVADWSTSQRVRVLLACDGQLSIDSTALSPLLAGPVRLAIDDRPVDTSDRFLFHKTTVRRVYEQAAARYPEADDVVLWNAEGMVTETTIANLVVRSNGEWLTPAVDCGLLAGTSRAELLASGRVREAKLPVECLATADALFVINSVRGWRRAHLLPDTRDSIQ